MPANSKYLTKSPWQKGVKLLTGVIGGYSISALFHMDLALFLPVQKEVLATSFFTIFLFWIPLLICPYFYKNGLKILGVYLLTIILLLGVYYVGSHPNPFIW